ncbi:4Fe-4S dicluster domain-containing protein [Peptoniphilus sp. KCTC 25270]|uniref:4Fe-4S dicluster domain-containing protein n=1 Tax=Peptoniphilus sp. KCTC 25270 TaxID=2897414 RepID=UPI001E4CBDA7|nr:4Fe-4S dicluster domain-containing protein [Peptoniphilus sp. KCTC 25270]MCD1147408.1 4Fe-4S dicluster domain-containing protein [Peptoniphilus sp. KCTC 25270]
MAKGRVTFDTDYCKGCGLCVSVCPKDVLALRTDQLNKKGYRPAYDKNPEDCIACTNCAITCPDSVISVYRLD